MNAWHIVLACLLLPLRAGAAEMRSVEVAYEEGIYTLESVVYFDVARAAVFDVFLDWDLAVDFSSIIVEAKNVGPDEQGGMGYYIHNRGCFLFFCKTTQRHGSVTSEGNSVIYAIADPATSDFELSEETWIFTDEGVGTIVHYELRMKPSFWVPPVVGPYMIKRKLRSDGSEAIDRIEKIAQQRAALDE